MVGMRVRKLVIGTGRILLPVAFVISTLAALAVAARAAQAQTRAVTPAMASFINFVRANHTLSQGTTLGSNPYTSQHQQLPDAQSLQRNVTRQPGGNSANVIMNGPLPGNGSAPTFSGTTSRYVVQNDIDDPGRLAQDGCNQSANGETGIVILDFGQPWQTDQGAYGTLITDHPRATNFVGLDTIASASEAFLWGYAQCATGNEAIALGIGTNNAGSRFSPGHGYAWAMMVNAVNEWVMQENFQYREYVAGASDIEVEYNPAQASENWVNSYVAGAQTIYFNYGDATGCPIDDAPTNRACAHNWMQSDVLDVSEGNGDGVALPEIYNTTGYQAKQWQSLSYLAHTMAGANALPIVGALTQYGACHSPGRHCDPTTDNTPQQGWQELYSILNSSQVTAQPVPFVSDITWDS
jgi:hypothetical protein